ncbi:MAG: hypothetical protein A2Y14_05795 [Verrucomicrobia bacterium GWF2_51_19]|nr:MAG: hypothetical protein A2Y14_05795 [Verrucomicrobia bacterium GWF2_51_19]HCJ12162.1 hypothetical protein [Opitutae bacterium]
METGFCDLMTLLSGGFIPSEPDFKLKTMYEMADRAAPSDVFCKNRRYTGFAIACEQYFKRGLKVLDLHCFGGGLVFDFLLRGHKAIGLYPSHFFEQTGGGYWRILSKFLFSADAAKTFTIVDVDNAPQKFDVICAWDGLELLECNALQVLCENVKKHLSVSGLFMGAVPLSQGKDEAWWKSQFADFDFIEELPLTPEQLPKTTVELLFPFAAMLK